MYTLYNSAVARDNLMFMMSKFKRMVFYTRIVKWFSFNDPLFVCVYIIIIIMIFVCIFLSFKLLLVIVFCIVKLRSDGCPFKLFIINQQLWDIVSQDAICEWW